MHSVPPLRSANDRNHCSQGPIFSKRSRRTDAGTARKDPRVSPLSFPIRRVRFRYTDPIPAIRHRLSDPIFRSSIKKIGDP